MNIKSIIASFVMTFGLLGAALGSGIELNDISLRGGDRPFPGDKAAPIELGSFEGFWAADDEAKLVFSFRQTAELPDGSRLFTIQLVEQETGKIVAKGPGRLLAHRDIIRGWMEPVKGGDHELMVRIGYYVIPSERDNKTEEFMGISVIKIDPDYEPVDKKYFKIRKMDLPEANPSQF
jgi:hypothetical protein